MKRSEIPFGAQFSPSQIDLPKLLDIIHEKAGNRQQITEAIRQEFFVTHATSQQWKLADNTVLALRAYQLLDEEAARPTQLADELLAASDDVALYGHFAKHILLNLRGLAFLETLTMMQISGEPITLHTLARQLEQRGLHVPRGSVHLSSMRLWLAKAGVFDVSMGGKSGSYEVNQQRVEELLGVTLDSIDSLTQLNGAQRAFLRALTRILESGPFVANDIADLATTLYGFDYNHKELPKSVLLPLKELGYIDLKKSTKGRGAKPYEVTRTEKFVREISDPILSAVAEQTSLVPRSLFERPLAQILLDLESPDRHVKGKALELLAIYFARLIDLDFKGWRLRSADTGGAEVDAIVEGARLIFSRWQIQAKNTGSVRLDDVAKEVGLSLTFIYSNVVLIITTGNFTKDAYGYVQHIHRTSNLNVILLNGAELQRISINPTAIVDILNHKAEQAMRVKERTDYFVAQ